MPSISKRIPLQRMATGLEIALRPEEASEEREEAVIGSLYGGGYRWTTWSAFAVGRGDGEFGWAAEGDRPCNRSDMPALPHCVFSELRLSVMDCYGSAPIVKADFRGRCGWFRGGGCFGRDGCADGKATVGPGKMRGS